VRRDFGDEVVPKFGREGGEIDIAGALGYMMVPSRFENLPRRTVAGREVPVAIGLRARTLGLALLDRDDAGPGLLIPRCAAVHTVAMRFALDLHFLDPEGMVLDSRHAVPPRRFASCRGAAAVLEIPA
jgi:uncharacterized membrane protein (UPF0127 family)